VDPWREVGDGVFVRRYAFFDQDIGAILGDGAGLVIDTRTTYAQARELVEDLSALRPGPDHVWIVVNTHFHFDHTFGNAVFRGAEIWGHERCVDMLRDHGEEMRDAVAAAMPDLAPELGEVEIVAPGRTVGDRGTIDVGGRRVELRYLGRAHTDNDLLILVPDASVAFAGDMIEQGAPPSFGDAFPLEWPDTLRAMLPLLNGPVVPGHGDVVDAAFVEAQLEEIEAAASAVRAAHAEGVGVEEAAARVPFPPAVGRDVAERAYAQLDGHI